MLTWALPFFAVVLFFVIPAGYGASLQRLVRRKDFSEHEPFLFSCSKYFLLGYLVQACLFLIFEGLAVSKDFLFFGNILYSILGVALFARELSHRPWSTEYSAKGFKAAILIGGSGLVSLLIQNYLFSSFPRINLYAQIHFMKAATEYASEGILNLKAADSYIPAFQIGWGNLLRLIHFDNLRFFFLLTFLTPLLFLTAFYHFALAFHKNHNLAVASSVLFGVLAIGYLSPNNNSILFMGCLILMLEPPSGSFPGDGSWWKKNVPLIGLALLSVVLQNYFMISAAIFLILVLAAVRLGGGFKDSHLISFFSYQIHRSAAFLLPIVFLHRYFFHEIIYKVNSLSRLRMLSLLLVFFTGFSVAAKLIFERMISNGNIFLSEPPSNFFTRNKLEIFNQFITFNPGSLYQELTRIVPPSLCILIFISLALILFKQSSQMEKNPHSQNQEDQKKFLFTVLEVMISFLIVSAPLRGSIRAAFLLCVYISLLTPQIYTLMRKLPQWAWLTSAALVLFSIFRIENLQGHTDSAFLYLKAQQPTIVVILICSFILFCFSFGKTKKLIFVSLFFLFSAEKIYFQTRFMTLAFGYRLPEDKVVSHYSLKDIEIYRELPLRFPQFKFVFSDPTTLSAVKAFSGLNPAYQFENIDYISVPEREHLLQKYTGQLLGCQPQTDDKTLLWDYLESKKSEFSGEANYFYQRKYQSSALYPWSMTAVIITPRTLSWIKCSADHYGYFPNDRAFTSQETENLHKTWPLGQFLTESIFLAPAVLDKQ